MIIDKWKFYPSDVFNLDENGIKEFDKMFLPKEKGYKPSQEEFKIASNAYIL